MKNLWNNRDAEATIKKYADCPKDLALRTYSARLLGQDAALVLHGGGNTSVKSIANEITGDPIPVLFMKGSGWDLSTIEPAGHPAVRLDPLKKLRNLHALSDEEMVNQLRIHLLNADSPNPSVESLLHAFLPHKFIDHTHADSVLALTNQPDAEKKVRDWTKGKMGIVPYIMPGFDLAKAASMIYEKDPTVEGLILIKHGIFTFAQDAEESYARMIRWVSSAENVIRKARAAGFHPQKMISPQKPAEVAQAANLLRGLLTETKTVALEKDPVERMVLGFRSSAKILDFLSIRELSALTQIGPATPDHVIRTKPVPLVVAPLAPTKDWQKFYRDAQKSLLNFQERYQIYFDQNAVQARAPKKRLDLIPRVILVPGMGIFAAGKDSSATKISLDIYEHTIDVLIAASRVGRYRALNQKDLFDMEYWSLEQAKLGKSTPLPFAGKIVWLSGAASGIGLATAKRFRQLGAHVFLTDIDTSKLASLKSDPAFKKGSKFYPVDVTDFRSVEKSFEACSLCFGGVDIVVSNAGYAPQSAMSSCTEADLRKSFELNFFAHQHVSQAAVRVLKRQALGGVLLYNASKSTFNPGPNFGPYTLPKSAVIALMKQYAIELGSCGIRSNAVNADRVRTGLFAGGVLEQRAKARGISVKDYLSGNLVQEEVYAEDVAEAFVYLASARKTTGAVLPVDGGNAAAFPR